MTVSNIYYDNDSYQQDKCKLMIHSINKVCSVDTVKNRLPIFRWLPRYNLDLLIQDMIAGITVGLTAIPQGLAYAVVAGLSPEYGLYSGLVGGFIYLVFGSCKDVTIGPTAIVSALMGKYVKGYSADFAVLAAFLAGLMELAMGILNLGVLVEFISMPVISGFTTAAALQIMSSQLKSLFGLDGPPGNYFAESIFYFFRNISSAKLWDSVLGFVTIGVLMMLQHLGYGCSRSGNLSQKIRWYLSLGRNAIVVILGMIVAYVLKNSADSEPLTLIGKISGGLPKLQPPPLSTTVGNKTYDFSDMMEKLGPQYVTVPLVAVLELVAIAKAFSGGIPIDAKQELIALGLCNIVGSFVSSMPITGSFTRTAINHKSGVQTPAGGIFTGFLVFLALSSLTSTFYYIPQASLAGLIIAAMLNMIDLSIFERLWSNYKRELLVLILTIVICLSFGLEYGFVAGVLIDTTILLYLTARPIVVINKINSIKGDYIIVPLLDGLSYCAAEHVRKKVLQASQENLGGSYIIIDATNLKYVDSTVASNLVSLVNDLEKQSCSIFFLNFNSDIRKTCIAINEEFESKFATAANVLDFVETLPKNV